jgi:oxygen-independent coproporphyrinogen-3 oxidase
MAKSLYIHMPFCRRRCIYCDFYSTIYDETAAWRYTGAIAGQITSLEGEFSTIYIGGGTPTMLSGGMLERILKSLKGALAARCEFTVEANPESLDAVKIKVLLDGGVNRLSIGVQSFDDSKLKRLGRMHDSRRANDSVALAAKGGFANISVDLMFGVWGEDMKTWEKDLAIAAALPVKHLSCYSLTYEKGTPLFDAVKAGSVVPLGEKPVAEMYGAAIERLAVRGFRQYEVSNFAKAGFECRHNLNYWENDPYTGIGASAVSYADGVRTENIADIGEYIRKAEARMAVAVSRERLSPARRAKETAAVKIRTKEGIDFAWFKGHTGYDLPELERKALPKLVSGGLIKYKKAGDRVTGIELRRKGFLFCDLVSSELV